MRGIAFKKLRWQLAAMLALVVFLTVSLSSLFSIIAANNSFELYVSGENRLIAESLAPVLERFYTFGESWNGLTELLASRSEEMLLPDWNSDVDWMATAADVLDMSGEELLDAYDAAPSGGLSEVAQMRGIDIQTIIDAIMGQEQNAVQQAIAAGELTEEEGDRYLSMTQVFVAGFVYDDVFGDAPTSYDFLYSPDVIELLLSTLPLDVQRVVVTAAEGFVVYDSLPDSSMSMEGSYLDEASLEMGVPLYNPKTNERIGTVIVASFSGSFDPQQQLFLQKIKHSIIWGGVIASLVGVLLGIWFSRRITTPVTALTHAAQALIHGHALQRLPVTSADELGQMTVAFNMMTEALAEQRALRKRLINDVAHELNTPLSVIQLELEALRDGLQTPDDAAMQVQKELEHLKNIIKDLIWLSETDDGELQLVLQPIDLIVVTKKMIAHWHKLAAAQEIDLHLQVDETVTAAPALVLADLFRLEQVMRNILSNAFRYTPAGGQIVVSLRRGRTICKNRGQDCIITSITDNGSGIPAQDLPHIFERFYRVDAARSRQKGGRGLGLAIARHIIIGHGGEIWAESQLGRGTTLFYALPVAPSHLNQDAVSVSGGNY
jgi:signal transduction histidine kinase